MLRQIEKEELPDYLRKLAEQLESGEIVVHKSILMDGLLDSEYRITFSQKSEKAN